MGKLVSIVTTCLVVSSSRITVIKIDCIDGLHDRPSSVSVPKHLKSEIWVRGINSLNFATEEQHGPS